MQYSNIPTAQAIIQQCKANLLSHIVISPGSRNAPLTISFTRDPFFSCYSIVDERCAAFFALGMAKFLKQPVALLCSSGSALLNYYPAVSEAFYSQIPLVVISADRPSYRIDVGDGQTIQQRGVYASHTVAAVNLLQDVSHASKTIARESDLLDQHPDQQQLIQANLEALQQGFYQLHLQKGPIHINVPFEEPLYGLQEDLEIEALEPLELPQLGLPVLDPMINVWNRSKRKMILVGAQDPHTISDELLSVLLEDDSVMMLTENTSNIHHPRVFASIDQLIVPIEKEDNSEALFSQLQPDILLTFGGMVVSKKIKVFLRKYQPKQHWHIDRIRAYDTYFCLDNHVQTNVSSFLEGFVSQICPVDSDYYPYWNRVREHRQKQHQQYMQQLQFSDLKVFDLIRKRLPSPMQLQLANSSTIRYAQLFDFDSNIEMYCNRGTSGIDGSTSTAIGAAVFDPNPTTLITGDLSFLYDSNALWNNYIPKTFRIILLNNNGGGIFRILPSAKDQEHFETFFETTHHYTAVHLAAMFQLDYYKLDTENDFESQWEAFMKDNNRAAILEIHTPREENDRVLRAYFNFLK
ncbi:MAG: 2-succinyl-5-enolpyruvyl-6-hydroxy-3-cyclohexene-1-carboxylic-acid synthase [Flavobacteriaceae bacterium]|nr:2-succinyl-5-enolpyruvyl-6-hydroxy-3-cyclohexene-1-carboxylic-acid synthase [Flavobacteriaceae bacterium]